MEHSGENPMSMQLSSHHCSSARTTSVQKKVCDHQVRALNIRAEEGLRSPGARLTPWQCLPCVHLSCVTGIPLPAAAVVQCQVLTRHCHLSTAPVALTVTARGPRSLPCMALSIHSQRPHSTAQGLCASTVVCRP